MAIFPAAPVTGSSGRRTDAMARHAVFSFPRFLHSLRMVWANACRYNSPAEPVHLAALRLCEMTEKRLALSLSCPDMLPDVVTAAMLPFLDCLLDSEPFAVVQGFGMSLHAG